MHISTHVQSCISITTIKIINSSINHPSESFRPLVVNHSPTQPLATMDLSLSLQFICPGLPWWLSGKEPTCDAGDAGSIPGSERSPGEGNGYPLQLEKEMATHSSTLAQKFHGWRSLVGYSPWGHKESDMTERLHHDDPLQYSCLENSSTLRPHGLQPARLCYPWHFSGRNTGVGFHFLHQGIFLTQGLNPRLLCLLHRQVVSSLAGKCHHILL